MVICKLLVLDPQARMTAGQVLDTLGAIIAQWYVKAAYSCQRGGGISLHACAYKHIFGCLLHFILKFVFTT